MLVDIVERLSNWKHASFRRDGSTLETMMEAANEITSLREHLEIAKKDGERWRYFIETCSSETGFELTGVSDASNEQINEAIDNAMKGKE